MKKLINIILILFFVVGCVGFGTDNYTGSWAKRNSTKTAFVIKKNGCNYIVQTFRRSKNYRTGQLQWSTEDFGAEIKKDNLYLEAGSYGMPRTMTYIDRDKAILFMGKKYYKNKE